MFRLLIIGMLGTVGICQSTYAETDTVREMRGFAEKGSAFHQFNLGIILLMEAERSSSPEELKKEAAQWFLKAAIQGNKDGQLMTARNYMEGLGFERDEVAGAKWLRLAADQGEAIAQWRLGMCYAFGRGVPLDKAEGMKWFLKSAWQGNQDAQGFVGVMYSKGITVPKDSVEGLAWLNLGAASGNPELIKMRDELEVLIGSQPMLAAQQRSKEIQAQIATETELARRRAKN